MAAIVASKVKRERQLRESKASFDASQGTQQQLHQRNGGKSHALSQHEAMQQKTKMMYYRKVGWVQEIKE